MLKSFKRIWKDVRRGENLDAYLTIAAAVVLSVLDILGVPLSNKLPAITIAVLALLAIASLVSRYRVEDLTTNLVTMREIFVDEFDLQLLRRNLELADEIWLFGASLDDVVNDYYSIFEKKVRDGKLIRAMIIDPNASSVLELSEMRAYANPDAHRASVKALGSLSDLCTLRNIAPKICHIRILKYPITHRLIAINPRRANGRLYISNYPFGTPGGSLPKFLLSEQDGHWFTHYKQEAENLWNAGKDWICSKT
jgi:hypothetical protein